MLNISVVILFQFSLIWLTHCGDGEGGRKRSCWGAPSIFLSTRHDRLSTQGKSISQPLSKEVPGISSGSRTPGSPAKPHHARASAFHSRAETISVARSLWVWRLPKATPPPLLNPRLLSGMPPLVFGLRAQAWKWAVTGLNPTLSNPSGVCCKVYPYAWPHYTLEKQSKRPPEGTPDFNIFHH